MLFIPQTFHMNTSITVTLVQNLKEPRKINVQMHNFLFLVNKQEDPYCERYAAKGVILSKYFENVLSNILGAEEYTLESLHTKSMIGLLDRFKFQSAICIACLGHSVDIHISGSYFHKRLKY